MIEQLELGSIMSIEYMTHSGWSMSIIFDSSIPGTDMTHFCLRCQYLVITSSPF